MLVDPDDATEVGGTGKASTDSDAIATTGVMRWTGVVGGGCRQAVRDQVGHGGCVKRASVGCSLFRGKMMRSIQRN